MRILFWIVICFFIFYLGMQSATMNQHDEAKPIIQNEGDLQQSSVNTDTFSHKHEEIIAVQTEERTSLFYSIAMFLEGFVKSFFSVVFQFLYRFSAMFF